MEEPRMFLWAPNLVAVCIDGDHGGDAYGRSYNLYSTEPEPFATQFGLLKSMDGLFDRLDYPQAALQYRSFRGGTAPPGKTPEIPPKVWTSEGLMKQMGDKATFIVNVQYRENATWQGTVTWTEKKKKQQFRSAFELMKLMDDAMREDDPPGSDGKLIE